MTTASPQTGYDRAAIEQALMTEVEGLRASIQLLPSNQEAYFKELEDAK